MDGVSLLNEAHTAGLTIVVVGANLKIRGPRRADQLARRLIANKAAVLEMLKSQIAIGPPPSPQPGIVTDLVVADGCLRWHQRKEDDADRAVRAFIDRDAEAETRGDDIVQLVHEMLDAGSTAECISETIIAAIDRVTGKSAMPMTQPPSRELKLAVNDLLTQGVTQEQLLALSADVVKAFQANQLPPLPVRNPPAWLGEPPDDAQQCDDCSRPLYISPLGTVGCYACHRTVPADLQLASYS